MSFKSLVSYIRGRIHTSNIRDQLHRFLRYTYSDIYGVGDGYIDIIDNLFLDSPTEINYPGYIIEILYRAIYEWSYDDFINIFWERLEDIDIAKDLHHISPDLTIKKIDANVVFTYCKCSFYCELLKIGENPTIELRDKELSIDNLIGIQYLLEDSKLSIKIKKWLAISLRVLYQQWRPEVKHVYINDRLFLKLTDTKISP